MTDTAGHRSPGHAATPIGVALAVVVFLETLRVWFPSVVLVFGRSGVTPATELGAFALIPFLAAAAVVPLLRAVPARALAVSSVTVLVVIRLVLQATAGGQPQLWLSTAGAFAGMVWLVAVAGAALAPRAAVLGLTAGLAADAALHAVLRSTDLAWRPQGWAWGAVVVLVAVTLGAWWRAGAEATGEPVRGWMVVGPVLACHLVVAGVVSRAYVLTGWPEPAGAGLVLSAHAAALLLALRAAHARPVWARWAAVVAVPAGTVMAVVGTGLPAAIGHLILPAGLALALVVVLRPTTRPRAGGAAGGLLLFFALVFTYYAGYDLVLPFPNAVALFVAAGVIAVLVAVAGPHGRQPAIAAAAPRLPVVAAGLAVVVAASTAGVAVAADPPAYEAGDGLPVRVMLLNLHQGFDVDGGYSVDRLAALIAAQSPDVVVLNEVSRGWLINASIDVLPLLSEHVGLPYTFAPAADAVWGNAVLSRYPVSDVVVEPLPLLDTPMRRSVLSLVIDLGEAELGVVATHLHHVDGDDDVRLAQAEQVADAAHRLADGGLPVAVLGDLNAAADAPELAPLASWLEDASAPFGPIATFPADDPQIHIDHILITADLTPSDFAVTSSTASDHLGVAATLDRR